MKLLHTLEAMVIGGYLLFNPNVSFSKTAAEVSDEIKVCYDKSYVTKFGDAQKRIAKDKCARRAIQRYADQDLGNKDGNATSDEINKAVLRLKGVVSGDINEKLNGLYPGVRVAEPVQTDDKLEIGPDLEMVVDELKVVQGGYSIKYGVLGQIDKPYSELILTGEKRFIIHDDGNDNLLNANDDCVEEGDKKFCGEDISKKSRAFIGEKETTHEGYFSELKDHLIFAYANYLLKNYNAENARIDKEKKQLVCSTDKFYFFVADSDNDGFTDTFVVKKGGSEGDVILKIYGDKTKQFIDIVGGLYNNLINR